MGIHAVPAAAADTPSLSRRARDLLAGDLGAHRDLPIDDDADTPTPAPVPVVERTVYSREDSRQAWLRRRADLEDLTGVAGQLDDVDKRVNEINRQAMALLSTETGLQTGVDVT